mmetsp:Transcript_123302/g.348425  ORF Transcript_123302/g.348425 Transcript_123302/m.348425 type:complete len:153 (-) Transcript_123302:1000-1458(-)
MMAKAAQAGTSKGCIAKFITPVHKLATRKVANIEAWTPAYAEGIGTLGTGHRKSSSANKPKTRALMPMTNSAYGKLHIRRDTSTPAAASISVAVKLPTLVARSAQATLDGCNRDCKQAPRDTASQWSPKKPTALRKPSRFWEKKPARGAWRM